MKYVIHKADTRGHANHGWLDSHHSFSFANYHNPERMNFGVLRVLNDDVVSGGKGFGTHPHENMEIISIPLKGDLEHKDSLGNLSVIREGDIQILSAGTGIAHSEYNRNKDEQVEFLQIWIFPSSKDLAPRYDQISIRDLQKKNEFYQVLSPNPDDDGVWINQNTWFSIGEFERGVSMEYSLHEKNNGVYIFVLEGSVKIDNHKLEKRDGFGIWGIESLTVTTDTNAKVLLMELPME
ncbi:pirin family protein [Gillisia sp. CAL575]|uniref:pirin family protein n=1 Tax=Gillisia sp. CAL575 TaxID=985255 RepID=UPI0003A5905B|nr:pirin family protein [Gillisia sp. CAL575]